MIKNRKKYFSFFGILLATATCKIDSYFSMIVTIISQTMPKITKLLLKKQLKPIKLYSTNNI